MSDGQELGKIATKKVPADQAKPGNPEHAAMIAQALGGAMGGGSGSNCFVMTSNIVCVFVGF